MNITHTPVLRNCLQMICEQKKKKKDKSAMHVFFATAYSICMSEKIVERYLLIICLKQHILFACVPSKKKDNSAP